MTKTKKAKSGKTHLSIPEQTIPSSAATCNYSPNAAPAIRLKSANQKQVVHPGGASLPRKAVYCAIAGASVLPDPYTA